MTDKFTRKRGLSPMAPGSYSVGRAFRPIPRRDERLQRAVAAAIDHMAASGPAHLDDLLAHVKSLDLEPNGNHPISTLDSALRRSPQVRALGRRWFGFVPAGSKSPSERGRNSDPEK